MDIVFLHEAIPLGPTKTVFLGGPVVTPGRESWRTRALELFLRAGFDGTVLVPEQNPETTPANTSPADWINWRQRALATASCTLLWWPKFEEREQHPYVAMMEFGELICTAPDRIVFGAPPDPRDPELRYLNFRAKHAKIPRGATLEETVKLALERLAHC